MERLLLYKKIKNERTIHIFKISKEEAKYLRENNLGKYVNRTFSKYKHYFVVENKKVYAALRKRKEEIIVYSYFGKK